MTSRAEDQKLLRLQVEEAVSSAEPMDWLMLVGPNNGTNGKSWLMDVNGDLFYGIIRVL